MKVETVKEEALLHTCHSLIKVIDDVLEQRNTLSNGEFARMELLIEELKEALGVTNET
jgi:hypothetical protein